MKSLYLSALVWLMACSSPSLTKSAIDITTDSIATAPAQYAMKEVSAKHIFSNHTTPDQFRLQLLGSTPLNANIHFSIITAGGDTLWSEHFPATRLISESDLSGDSDVAREAYIMQHFATFFQQESFIAAAVEQSSNFDPELNGSQQVWEEVKAQQQPGFFYVLGVEDGRTLAYSIKLRKAVIVEHCC